MGSCEATQLRLAAVKAELARPGRAPVVQIRPQGRRLQSRVTGEGREPPSDVALEAILIVSGGGAPMSRVKAARSSVLALYRLSAQPTPNTRSLNNRSDSGFQ